MQDSLTDYFIAQMQKQLDRRAGIETITMDMRDDGLDFCASLTRDEPLSYYCRGTRYEQTPEGTYTMEAADGTVLPIDEDEYRSRLDYALSCIGASSETGVSVLVKKHIKNG